MENFNVKELFNRVFGVNEPIYKTESHPTRNLDYRGVQTIGKKQPMSWLGTPILLPITFKSRIYKYYGGEPKGLTTKMLSDFRLPATSLITMHRAKNIIKTPVCNSGGTAKELITNDDWHIKIQGICLNEPDNTARNQMKELLQYERVWDTIEVESEWLNDMDINGILIKEFSTRQIQARPSMIPFEIIAYENPLFEEGNSLIIKQEDLK